MFAAPILARGLAALLALQPGAAPAPAATTSPGERFDAALELQARRQYAEAAAAFESLRADTGLARYRLQAGQAREAAGQLAHAIEQWQALLAEEPGMTPARRAEVQARIDGARKKTVPVDIRVEGEAPAATTTVTLRRLPDDRPPLARKLVGGAVRIDLDPGPWDISVEAPGFVVAHQEIALPRPGKGPAAPVAVALMLARDVREVALELGPPEAIAAGLKLTLRAGEGVIAAPDVRTVVVAQAAAQQTLDLPPGSWTAALEAPGYITREVTIVVGEAPPEPLTLEPVPPPPKPATPAPRPPPDPRLGLGLGLGLGGGLVFGTGVGLVVRSSAAYPNFTPAPDNAGYVAAVGATDLGAAMIGGGLGLGATALTAGLGARNRVLWGELGGGGVLAIAGVSWYVTEWQHVQKMLYDGNKAGESVDLGPLRRETVAASLLGAGAGLVLGAGVALLTRYLVARKAAAPRARVGLGPTGLVARF